MCGLPERTYLVTLANRDDKMIRCQIVLTTPCLCDLQEFVDSIADEVMIDNPVVYAVDDKAAAHLMRDAEMPAAS